ncbi:MAG: hypothetical protein KDH09_13590, partial [Chrysiogenetes bacterium]|nr:hypothetical protein [Chrysiogenetes bacterium]
PGETMLIPDSLLFLPDPLLPSDAFFTKPVCGMGGADVCDTGAGDASDGGLNQNCKVLTSDATAGMTVISCSDNAADYERTTLDPLRPRVPVWFEIEKVLGTLLDPTESPDDDTEVSLVFDGPSGTGLTYRVCEGPGTTCRPSTNGDIVYVSPGTTLGQTDDLYLYPPFSPTPFGGVNGISVSVDVPDTEAVGFAPATKKLLFNPECTTPVALQCEFAGDDTLVPGAPPACFSDRGGRANAFTDGVECEYVECKVVSYAESVPGTGPSIGPTMCADEPVPDGLYSLFVADDGDTEVEGFCEAGDTCNVGSFTATRSLAISTQRARFYVQVNNNQTASPTIQADFLARLRKVDQSDLSPANLIELTPPFTMGRDPTLPASLAIAFEDSLAAPTTAIYSQHAASSTTAPELFNFYGMDASTKYGDPFAARVMVTIKDFNGDDYVNAGDNPTCQVRLSASGSAAGTTFPTLSAGDCDAPLEAPKTLTQVSGNPVVGACVISNGNVNAATATATVTAAFTGGCTTGMNSGSITVRSVPRSARFRYNVTNTAGSTVPFTGLQANADLDTTIFCTPSDGDCAGVPQPEDFFPVDLLAAKGPQGELLEDGMGGAETRALYSEIPPGTCANAFSIAGLATRGVWSFDLSLHPDPDGDGTGPGELLDRLDYDVSAIPVPTITSQEVTQRFNNVMFGFCDFGTISEVQFSILQGTPLYFGAP